jgi:hypothetical protein
MGSPNMRISRLSRQLLRPQSTTPIIVATLVLTASLPALAQSDSTPGAPAPPAREGNIYDHRDHQPTEGEVGAAERAAGTGSSSSDTRQQVEDDVRRLLQQTDRLDKQSEQQEQDYPSGPSLTPKADR